MYPDPQAAAVMRGVHCAHARFVWNLCVEQQSWWRHGRGRAPGAAERQHQLAEARAAEPWLAEGSSSVQQEALRDFDKAMAALVTSDGQHYRAPRISDRDAARYLGLQRRLARQRKGSRRREKTRQALARIAARTADRRKDWAEKTSTRLVREHDVIVLEKLNIKGMTRRPAPKSDPEHTGAFLPNRGRAKAGLNRSILASCWGTLGHRTEQKAAASGVAVICVDPRFTSQQCHMCGHTSRKNRESQAAFLCESCGHADHADANAARNILARGLLLSQLRSSSCARPGARGITPAQDRTSGSGNHPECGVSRPEIRGLQAGEDVKAESTSPVRARLTR